MNRIQNSPWGYPDYQRNLDERGIAFVSTPSHGGLTFTPETWQSLPQSARESFMTEGWAEEDCEMAIAMALLGLTDDEISRLGILATAEQIRESAKLTIAWDSEFNSYSGIEL